MKCPKPALIAFLFAFILSCSTLEPELKIIHQVTGPIETNCYLIYDNQTMEAALVDVGDVVDTLNLGFAARVCEAVVALVVDLARVTSVP